MTRQKKLYIGLAGFAGFLLIVLLVFNYLTSTFVNSEGMRKKVQTIISIPVKVKGDIENPKISYLSPSAVGKKLLNTTKRVLKTPVKIIKPVIPGKKKNCSNSAK